MSDLDPGLVVANAVIRSGVARLGAADQQTLRRLTVSRGQGV